MTTNHNYWCYKSMKTMIQWQLHPSTTAGTEKFKEKSSRNTTTSNGGTPCASKNEYNDAKIKKYSTASASEQLICEETQREFNLLGPQPTIHTSPKYTHNEPFIL